MNRTESRVPDQNGISQAYYIVEIHHSGQEPSRWNQSTIGFQEKQTWSDDSDHVNCLQVDHLDPSDDRSVVAMYIRGWKVDVAMMGVLQQCWRAMTVLHSVHLWRAGLTAQTLTMLGSCLPLCTALHSLHLDNNLLVGLPLAHLLGRGTRLKHLSLRFCDLDDGDARRVGRALCRPVGRDVLVNTTLLTLDLSNNRVGDVGAAHLADALKVNRTLLVLSLASNAVGDEGARRVAEACSWFPVQGELLAVRRAMVRAVKAAEAVEESLSSHGSHCTWRRPRRKSSVLIGVAKVTVKAAHHRRMSALRQAARCSLKPPSRKSKKFTCAPGPQKVPDPAHRALPETDTAQRPLKGPDPAQRVLTATDTAQRPLKGPDTVLDPPIPSRQLFPTWLSPQDMAVKAFGAHPLLHSAVLHEDQVWLPGNCALVSLNLSNNQMGTGGVRALLGAVEEQTAGLAVGCGLPGLLRVVFHRNNVPAGCRHANTLQRKMKVKDPLFLCPLIDLSRSAVCPCALPVTAVF